MTMRHTFRSAAYVFLIKGRKVLLARRFNTGYKDGQYSTMSGHVEAGESIDECAIREIEEEAGVKIKPSELRLFHVMNRYSDHDYIDFYFLCKKWQGSPIIGETDKCDDISWFDLDKLPDNTIDYIKTALDYYKSKVLFSKYGW